MFRRILLISTCPAIRSNIYRYLNITIYLVFHLYINKKEVKSLTVKLAKKKKKSSLIVSFLCRSVRLLHQNNEQRKTFPILLTKVRRRAPTTAHANRSRESTATILTFRSNSLFDETKHADSEPSSVINSLCLCNRFFDISLAGNFQRSAMCTCIRIACNDRPRRSNCQCVTCIIAKLFYVRISVIRIYSN